MKNTWWAKPFLLVLAAALAFFLFSLSRRDLNQSEQATPTGEPLFIAGVDAGYIDSRECQPCHSSIYETYQHTGMGRSFYRPTPDRMVEDWGKDNVFYHRASDRYYTMYQRDGKYYQRRHQIGFGGKEANVLEREIHFIMGSGNHARTYLHRSAGGKLIQLPVAWYSEKGGFWAMNPGYDQVDHYDLRRRITYECMFCHNAYPEIEAGADAFGKESLFKGTIPEGIDCQRCHGPGRKHITTVRKAGATIDAIRASIVNPARLSSEKQLELCMQCHLETTSARLPPYVRRYERGFFSYRAGEPLGEYIFHFDQAPGTGHEDKFEIVNAPYRLRISKCFQKSDGDLNCITCHDPHQIPRGREAVRHYTSICLSCHRFDLQRLVASGRHTKSEDCLTCHMPKRRTDDVIHVVMTDHYIQRFKPRRDLLEPLDEKRFYGHPYKGEVVLYYPQDLKPADKELYVALAQVKDRANLKPGIVRLESVLKKHQPPEAGFYFDLAEAYIEDGQTDRAIAIYEEALRRKPDLWPAQRKLGIALSKSGALPRAAELLMKAAEHGPEPALTLSDLAIVYQQEGKLDDAAAVLKKATRLEPDRTEAHNNLGGILLELGQVEEAEQAFREALRVQPDFVPSHTNLAKLLAARGDFEQAQFHYQRALQVNPDHAQTRYDYGLLLVQMEKYAEAETQLRAAVQLRPDWPDARSALDELIALRRLK